MFLDYIKDKFEKIVIVDTEYKPDISNTIPKDVLCIVYKDFKSGEIFRHWTYKKDKSGIPHFDMQETLFVSFYAPAEVGSFLNLYFGRPNAVWDVYVENAKLYKTKRSFKGGLNLLNTANAYGIKNIMSEQEKKLERDLILEQQTYTPDEELRILNYCQRDVETTAQVFEKQVADIERHSKGIPYDTLLWQALFRGQSMACAALVEKHGIPVDVKKIKEFEHYWPKVKIDLIEKLNKDINVFDGLRFNHIKFEKLIRKINCIDIWPRTFTNKLKTDIDTLEKFKHIEQIQKLLELSRLTRQTNLKGYVISEDGRSRTRLNMFGAVTGRCTPSTAKYPFCASAWARNFMRPTSMYALVYLDYVSQEPAIQAYLSGDKNLLAAYKSGDIYIHTAKLAKMVPTNATKQSHPKERSIFKVVFLANSYGMGPRMLAKKLKISIGEAKALMIKFKKIYSVYYSWINKQLNNAGRDRRISTCYGWDRYLQPFQKTNDRSMLNFPIQSHGAEILRMALINLCNEHIEVVATVHDAVVCHIPIPELQEQIIKAKRIMKEAAAAVVNGPIEVESQIIKSNWKQEGDNQKLYEQIMEAIENYKAATETNNTYYDNSSRSPYISSVINKSII